MYFVSLQIERIDFIDMKSVLKALTALILMMVFALSCQKPDEPNNDGNANGSSTNGHEYVDLGLPSGTLWATCNVGAETPEDYGNYYAWGETTPKELYDWKNYKYGRLIHESYELNKYCTDSCYGFNGFVDNLTILLPNDDAATVNWGEDWRMPTREEWEELFQNTTYIITTMNGVDGCLFTATDGNSLFLPAAGYWWGGEFNGAGIGVYWSSSVNIEFPNRAWGYHINPDSSHVCGSSDRNRGQTVRAVRVDQ